MLALATAILAVLGAPAAAHDAHPGQISVALRLNGGDYRPGDRVQVEVEAGEDGYLLVLRVDGDGYIRALFPLDPDLDQFVRGDRRYQLRGRGERESFLADDRGGTGLVMAFLSREPFATRGHAVGTHWDYERLRLEDPAGDAEAQVLALVRAMTGNGRFDYDVVGYRVWGPGYESTQPVVVADPYRVDPYWGSSYACLACGYGHPRAGVTISFGNHWYDPWYDPWYDRWDSWDWRYQRSGWNGWWGWDPYWGTPWRPITVINTPPRPVVANPIYGTRARARVPVAADVPVNTAPRLTDPVRGTVPPRTAAVTDGRSRGRAATPTTGSPGRGVGRVEAPPARPTTPPSRATPPATGSDDRSRSRRSGSEEIRTLAPETRRAEERPVYRPPVAAPTVERRAEPRGRPASSPPPRSTERSTPPSPPRSVERSSPPPASPPRTESGSTRSRSRGTN